jgi:NADPH:quinone reductase
LPLNLTLLKSCQVIGVFWGEFAHRFPARHRENVAALMELYLRGLIKPAVTARFPLAQGAQALASLETRAARGKVVVTVE